MQSWGLSLSQIKDKFEKVVNSYLKAINDNSGVMQSVEINNLQDLDFWLHRLSPVPTQFLESVGAELIAESQLAGLFEIGIENETINHNLANSADTKKGRAADLPRLASKRVDQHEF